MYQSMMSLAKSQWHTDFVEAPKDNLWIQKLTKYFCKVFNIETFVFATFFELQVKNKTLKKILTS